MFERRKHGFHKVLLAATYYGIRKFHRGNRLISGIFVITYPSCLGKIKCHRVVEEFGSFFACENTAFLKKLIVQERYIAERDRDIFCFRMRKIVKIGIYLDLRLVCRENERFNLFSDTVMCLDLDDVYRRSAAVFDDTVCTAGYLNGEQFIFKSRAQGIL